jgi:hypothetical protein
VEPGLAVTDRRLVEEIASLRCVLRRTLALAQEAGDGRTAVSLAEIYGQGCTRLARLLRAEGDGAGKLEAYLNKVVEEALTEVREELGIGKNL